MDTTSSRAYITIKTDVFLTVTLSMNPFSRCGSNSPAWGWRFTTPIGRRCIAFLPASMVHCARGMHFRGGFGWEFVACVGLRRLLSSCALTWVRCRPKRLPLPINPHHRRQRNLRRSPIRRPLRRRLQHPPNLPLRFRAQLRKKPSSATSARRRPSIRCSARKF